MTIAFKILDTTKKNAGSFVESVKGPKKSAFKQSKITLIIGTATAASTGAKLAVTRVFDAEEGHDLWGYGTPIGAMVQESLETNAGTELYVLASSDASGTAHTKTITLTSGPATAAGIVKGKLGGMPWSGNFDSGATITEISDVISAAIALLPKLPMSAANVAGVTTFTAKWKGASANDILLTDVTVADSGGNSVGVTVAVANVVTGATDPDLTDAMGVLSETDIKFTEFVTEYTSSTALGLIEDELNRRALPEIKSRGQLFVVKSGTEGTFTTFMGSRSNEHVCAIGFGTGPGLPWVYAAHVAALRSRANDPLKTSLGKALPNRIPTCVTGENISSNARERMAALNASCLKLNEYGQLEVEILRMCDGQGLITQEILAAIEYDFNNSNYEQIIVPGLVLVSKDKDPQAANEIDVDGVRAIFSNRIQGPLRGYFKDPQAASDALVVEENPSNDEAVDIGFSSDLVKFITRTHTQIQYS